MLVSKNQGWGVQAKFAMLKHKLTFCLMASQAMDVWDVVMGYDKLELSAYLALPLRSGPDIIVNSTSQRLVNLCGLLSYQNRGGAQQPRSDLGAYPKPGRIVSVVSVGMIMQ